MPKIPTILANQTLSRTPQQEAGIAAFDQAPGLDALGRGLYNFGAGATHAAKQVTKQRQDEVDARYIGDSFFQEINHLNEWQAKNSSSETYYQDFKNYAESRIPQYEAAAPSKEAKIEIRQKLQSAILSRSAEALSVTERTRMEKSKESVISQTSFALNTIRNTQGDPIGEAENARSEILSNVDRMFGSVDPSATRKIRGYVDSEFALAIAETDKEHAQALVRESTDLSEEQKVLLNNKIETISRVTNSVAIDETNMARRDHLAAVANGSTTQKLPLETYGVLKDPGAAKREDDFKVDVLVGVNKAVEGIGGLNPQAQLRELSNLRAKADTEMGRLIYQGAREKIMQIQDLQEKDRVSWMTQYNPEVKKLTQWAAETPEGSAMREERLNQLNESVLKYQGYAPLGALDADAYLGLASNDRQLMSVDQAAKSSAFINQGSPKEVIERINQTLARYPNKDHQFVAFSNMVTMPGKEGLRQEYQLVWQNKDQWWIPSFINALADSKSFGQLTDERKKELESEILDDKTWKLFQQSMIGPGGDRADEIAGFKSGISMYANYFHATQGDKLNTSVRKSIDKLINSTMGFAEVHGRPLMITRDREGKPPRTDDEIADLGRRLTVSLRDLDPREIDQSRFVALAQINPDEKNVNRLQALRDDITRNSFFVTDDDGQFVTLYMVGDDGLPFQLRDKKNQAFQIKLDDLPNFTTVSGAAGGQTIGDFGEATAAPTIAPFEVKQRAEDTYPIKRDYGPGVSLLDKILGWPEKITHWPRMGPYWRRKAGE